MTIWRPIPILTLLATMLATPVGAELQFDSLGVSLGDSVKNFGGLQHIALTTSLRHSKSPAHFLLPASWHLSVGHMVRGDDDAFLVSFGPTLQFNFGASNSYRWFVELGSHPTWLSDSVFEGKDLGGKLHFMSRLGLGAYLNDHRSASIMIDYRHISNAGLENTNPGIDLVSLSLTFHFDHARR